jgi:hypothetical protein
MKKTNWKQLTIIFMAVMFCAIAVWDVLAISQGGTEASISSTIITWTYKFPAFTFLMGFIMGHLFWRMKPNDETKFIDQKKEEVK